MIWKAQELHFALEMLASGLDLEGQAWEDHVYHPTKWSDEGIVRTKPNKTQMDGLKARREMKRNPSPLAAHFASQPAFTREAVTDTKVAKESK